MRTCIQRVSQARVELPDENSRISGQIQKGFLILLGVSCDDGEDDARYLAKKIASLRVFDDGEGKMNLNLSAVQGKVLVISQFTLFANPYRGNRPSFTEAAPPDRARELYQFFIQEVRQKGITVEEGVFQANMSVHLTNDGPVTIWIDSRERFQRS